jgi:Bacterial SH3 domain
MKIKQWTVFVVSFVLGLHVSILPAQQPAPETPPPVETTEPLATPPPAAPSTPVLSTPVPSAAVQPETPAPAPPAPASSEDVGVIRQNHVNIRGKAAIGSSIVTHLNQGDRVTVLEAITLKKPKTDEPDKWLRIALPSGVPVWVHSAYVDSQLKTVKPKRLNLRSGPGENYPILGRISQGTVVHELETKGNWIKIEAPADAYAFVAAHLVDWQRTAPAVAAAGPPKPIVETVPPAPGATTATNPPPEIPAEAIATETVAQEPPAVVGTEPPAVAPPPTEPVPPAESTEPPEAAPPPEAVEPPPKRIVMREGIVRRSVSIQAPTYFVLENVNNGRVINYLHSPSTNIVLKDFYGARILVKGEELLDERWPKTPVINIESVETVP